MHHTDPALTMMGCLLQVGIVVVEDALLGGKVERSAHSPASRLLCLAHAAPIVLPPSFHRPSIVLPSSFLLPRAIVLGNTLHKTAVLAGLGCFLTALFSSTSTSRTTLPLAGLSLSSGLAYDLLWQNDPLCQYQVAKSPADLAAVSPRALPLAEDFTVLVRRDDGARRILHNTIMVAATGFALWRFRQAS